MLAYRNGNVCFLRACFDCAVNYKDLCRRDDKKAEFNVFMYSALCLLDVTCWNKCKNQELIKYRRDMNFYPFFV